MTVQYLLVFIDRPVQITLYHPEMIQILLFLLCEPPDVNILLFQRLRPALHHLPIVPELLLRIADGIQILHQNLLIILHGIIQRVAPDLPHRLLYLLKLNPHQIEDILDLIYRLVELLLLKMHLKDHLMNRKFHIILDLEGGKQQIISVVRQII